MQHDAKYTRKRPFIWIYILLSIVAFVIIFGIYIVSFGKFGISDNQQFWSYLGTYLGGVLTPLLTIITIAILLHTLKTQSDELELQRKELELTREELKMTREEMKNQTTSLESQRGLLQQNQFLMTFYKFIDLIHSVQEDDKCSDKSHTLDNEIRILNGNAPKMTPIKDIGLVYNRLLTFILLVKLLDSNKPIIDYAFYSEFLYSQINQKSKEIFSKASLVEGITIGNIELVNKSLLQKL